MNDKQNSEPQNLVLEWEVVEDQAPADPVQHFARGMLQRTVQRLSHTFQRSSDPDDPRAQARAAFFETMEETDAVLNDLFSKYLSRLNSVEVSDFADHSPRAGEKITVRIEPAVEVFNDASSDPRQTSDEVGAIDSDVESNHR